MRLIIAALAAASLVAGGLFLERIVGPAELGPAANPRTSTGAWYCPHGGGEGWRAWLVVANPSEAQDAEVRIVTYRDGPPAGLRTAVPPLHHAFVEVPAGTLAAGSSAEFFGPGLVAGWVTQRQTGSIAAEPCARRAATDWYVAEGTSVRGHRSLLVVMNPFAQEAVFDVVVVAGEEELKFGDFTGVVLPGRRTTVLDLNAVALGRPILAAVVHSDLGEVVPTGFGMSDGGLRAGLASPEPAATSLLPATGGVGVSNLGVLVPGGAPTSVVVRAQGTDEQVPALNETSIGAGQARRFKIEDRQAGLFVEAPEGQDPFVAARRLTVEKVDTAILTGAGSPATRWLATPAVGPEGGSTRIVLQNPGGEDARVAIRLLGTEGPVEAPDLEGVAVPAGRSVIVDPGEERPVSALVEAAAGSVVASQIGRTPEGFGAVLGIALD